MKGIIYIAGSFNTVRRMRCRPNAEYLDNDPHFWTSPPTWGICRNDRRRQASIGDYIFFVLPIDSNQSQCPFGYLRVERIVTHEAAYWDPKLRSKRMAANKNPNGNILVNAHGNYNIHDGGQHRHMFERVRGRYVVGDAEDSIFLNEVQIRRLAPRFLPFLHTLFKRRGRRPIDFISRAGQTLNPVQVRAVVRWMRAVPR